MSDTTGNKYTYDSFVFDLEQTGLESFSEGYSYKEGIKEVNTTNFLSNSDTPDADGYFPLTYACGNGVPPEYIAKLINYKNIVDKTAYTTKGIGKTPLQVAGTSMAIDTVKLLLGKEVDCNPLVCRVDVTLSLTSEFPINELKVNTLPKTSSEYKLYQWILDDSNVIPQTTFDLDPNDGTIEEQERKKQRKEAKHQTDREKKAIDLLTNAIKEPFMLRKMVTLADASAYINKINFALQNYFKSEYYTIPVDKLQPFDEATGNGSKYESDLEKASIEDTEYFRSTKVTYLDLCSACSLPEGGELVKLLVDYWDDKLDAAIDNTAIDNNVVKNDNYVNLNELLYGTVKDYIEFLNAPNTDEHNFTPLHYTATSGCYDTIKCLIETKTIDFGMVTDSKINDIDDKSASDLINKPNPGFVELFTDQHSIIYLRSDSDTKQVTNIASSASLTSNFENLLDAKCYRIISKLYMQDKLVEDKDSGDKKTFSKINAKDYSTIDLILNNHYNGDDSVISNTTALTTYKCYRILTSLIYHGQVDDYIQDITGDNTGLISELSNQFSKYYINLSIRFLEKVTDSYLNTAIINKLLAENKITNIDQVNCFNDSTNKPSIATGISDAISKPTLTYDNIEVLINHGNFDLVQALYSKLNGLHIEIVSTLITQYIATHDTSRLDILIQLDPSPLDTLTIDQLIIIDNTNNSKYLKFIAALNFTKLLENKCFNAIFYKLINTELTEDDITTLNKNDSDYLNSIATAFSSLSDDNAKLDIINTIIQNDCDILFNKLVRTTSGSLSNHIWIAVNDTTPNIPNKIASAITTKELITEINCVNQSLYNILRLYAKAKNGKLKEETLDKLNSNKDKSAIESVFSSTYSHCTNASEYNYSLLKILIDNKFTFIIDVLNQLVKFNSYEIGKIQKAIQAGNLDGSLLPSIIYPSIPEKPEPEPHVNTPPVIILDSYFTCDSNASISIDASNSYDNENDTLSFSWSGNGANYLSSKTSSCPIFTPPSNLSSSTAYSLTVTVTDTHGLSSSKSATVQCVASKNIGTFAFVSGTFAVETDSETKMCTTTKEIKTVKSEWEKAYTEGYTSQQVPKEPYSLIYDIDATVTK